MALKEKTSHLCTDIWKPAPVSPVRHIVVTPAPVVPRPPTTVQETPGRARLARGQNAQVIRKL